MDFRLNGGGTLDMEAMSFIPPGMFIADSGTAEGGGGCFDMIHLIHICRSDAADLLYSYRRCGLSGMHQSGVFRALDLEEWPCSLFPFGKSHDP